VQVHKVTIEKTIEDRILELQRMKQELIDAAVDGGHLGRSTKLTLQDLMMLFGD
jgi:SNF2 family DNA or RNA helicase